MSIELITFLLLATFIALLVTGLPLAWVMGATAVIFSLKYLAFSCSVFRSESSFWTKSRTAIHVAAITGETEFENR